MTKQRKFILMTLLIIAGILLYCWITFLTTDVEATWRHYFGLLFFLLICICFFRNLAITTIATGVYLILGTFDLLALTPTISTFGFRFGPVSTPDIQGLSLGLFILYFILNMDPLIDIYLDYKEMKSNQND